MVILVIPLVKLQEENYFVIDVISRSKNLEHLGNLLEKLLSASGKSEADRSTNKKDHLGEDEHSKSSNLTRDSLRLRGLLRLTLLEDIHESIDDKDDSGDNHGNVAKFHS